MSRWVCLMYHDVIEAAPTVSGGRTYFAVSAASFEAQLDLLAAAGLRGCSMEDALGGARDGVAITFDDGDEGQFRRAFPLLLRHRMTATFFVTTDWVGKPGFVSWDGLREMRAAGMSIQSHTRSHPFLSELVSAAVREELAASRDVLNEKLEQRTTSLSLPGGDVPRPAFRHHLAESGYTAVATSRWGVNRPDSGDGPVWVRRCTVNGNVPADVFRRIALGDPWLALRRRVREASLAAARRAMGPSRYARLRRAALDALGRASSPTDSG